MTEGNYEKLSELSKKRLENRNPLRIFDSKDPRDVELSKNAPKITEFLSNEHSQEFENLKQALKFLGIPFKVDETLVRGLDYYCGVCFEIKEDKNEERMQDTLIGGGRYDYLANYLGRKSDKPLPGIG